MEQKVKTLLGDYIFNIMFLQDENEKLKAELAVLKEELEACKKPIKKQ